MDYIKMMFWFFMFIIFGIPALIIDCIKWVFGGWTVKNYEFKCVELLMDKLTDN